MGRLLLCAWLCCGCISRLPAQGWPQGGGPGGEFVTQGQAPAEWSVVQDRNIAWVQPLPETGQSTVVISGDRLFYTRYAVLGGPAEIASEIVACCADAKTGQLLWSQTIPAGHPLRVSGCFSDSTSPPPVTDGKRVCFFNASGAVVCFDFEGRQLWRRETMAVGRSQPFLVHGRVVYTRQLIMPEEGKFGHEHRDAPHELWTQLEALDLTTGEAVWSSDCGVNMGAIPLPQKLSDGRVVIVVGRGGGHSPPERPEGVSMVDGRTGETLWTLPLDNFMSTQLYPVVNDQTLVFYGPEHLWVDLSGKISRRVNFCTDAVVRKWDGGQYVNAVETLKYPTGRGRAITQQSNLRIGDYHYFRAYRHPYLGRVQIRSGKVEYLQLPVQLVRKPGEEEVRVWGLKDAEFIPADMTNADGHVVMGDRRSRTNTWGHHASPLMTVVGQHLYLPTMSGTVYCIRWDAEQLHEEALLGISDLGPVGPTWTRASISYDSGRLFTRTIRNLICIEAERVTARSAVSQPSNSN